MESFDREKTDALRMLDGLENGGLPIADAVILAEDLDPVYVYIIVNFLRANYPASDPAATSVLDRVVRLTADHSVVIKKHHEGELDPVSKWFEQEHGYGSYRGRGRDLVDLIFDKLST